MLQLTDILELLGVAAAVVAMIFFVQARRKGKAAFESAYAKENVCEHLRPALEALLARGHVIDRVGQVSPEMPLEIHLSPPFDPQGLYGELGMKEPVFLSERNVLFCKEDWCELHPQ